jgi:hypothetical protein
MLAGAVPVALAAAAANLWPTKEQPDRLYLRIVDDNYDLPADYPWEKVGAFSAMLVRKCGINRFENDAIGLHHAGSTFVSIDEVSTDKLDCLIGEARINGLTISISRGTTPITVECLQGRPARFQPSKNIDQEAVARCERLRQRAANSTADERK